ncbi:MAG: DUF4277 domain-containing protein [Chloroflexi bacterium]|nr:DUF4277 domain-containing protein [Chloroflexota bacterium]
MTVRALVVKRLGALPVIVDYLERLQVKERVDALAPVRGVAHLTNGEVVAALVANRLTAPRPLKNLVSWAVEEALGIPPAALNDDRWGRCLDDLAALARVEALDGYDVLETTRTASEADAVAVLTEWKGQWQVDHRHRDAKGPLRIRPLFVTSNRRIVGLITLLGIALLVFSLIERAARRALAVGDQVPNLLAGHVAARPTGDHLLKALRGITLVTVDLAGVRQRWVADRSGRQRTLLRLLGVPEVAYAQLTSEGH